MSIIGEGKNHLDTGDYQRLYERERRTRRDAEEIIERKTREVYLANQKVQKVQRLIESSSKAKSYYLRKMAHDLRTPLSCIALSAQLLGSKKELDTYTERKIEGVLEQCGKLEAQINYLSNVFALLDPSMDLPQLTLEEFSKQVTEYLTSYSFREIKLNVILLSDLQNRPITSPSYSINWDVLKFYFDTLFSELDSVSTSSPDVHVEVGLDAYDRLLIKICTKQFKELGIAGENMSKMLNNEDESVIQTSSNMLSIDLLNYISKVNNWVLDFIENDSVHTEGNESFREVTALTLLIPTAIS